MQVPRSPGPLSRPEPKCLGSWERPAPFFSSLATASHYRLLMVPKQPPKTLRELGPGPEAENGRKKRSGRAPLLMLLGDRFIQPAPGGEKRREERKSSLHALLGPVLVVCVVEGDESVVRSRSLLLQLPPSSPKSCS
ncbi:uncharacterized protein LOC105739042 isoform X2 [Nomascus leucogenys]|uniref:uncharacterized protein LOC105739042 isoform X2 n=1 Tax=Nomascus leucogenys TaxID=61853 RepID=UPI00122D78F1|nr:uncharacterized protein LOC105739042 isoform X2 [Nomascus leucogenys]